MIDYDHLRTEISQTRYAIAGLFLKQCKTIVEIGGSHYTSIHQHIPKTYGDEDYARSIHIVGMEVYNNKYWNFNSAPLQFHRSSVEQFDFYKCLQDSHRHVQDPRGRKGLCILGLELFPETKGSDPAQVVCDILEMFDVVVIDYVVENQLASSQADKLKSKMMELDMHCAINLTSEWNYDHKYFVESHERGNGPNPSFYKTRRLMVFKK